MAARVEGPAATPVPRSIPTGLPFRSLISKLILLLVIFCAVPVILYVQFREADAEKRFLLMESVREQGRMVAESLRPLLEQQEVSSLPLLNDEVARFATEQTGVKVLFRPTGEYGAESFFFVASKPSIAPTELAEERDRLVERGVFDNLAQSCWGELSMALRHRRASGAEELLTSITPINTDAGCWAVITTHSTSEFLGTSIDQPYWKTIEVRIAAAIYFAMAIFTIGLFVSIWRGLMRFRRLARSIRTGASHVSFAQQNRVPELAPVAEEFDRMTVALQDSAESIRLAAEDNAHAFKTPIAIMRQSLEPLRRFVASDEVRGQRALDVLEVSIDRLDHLVAYARRLEETTAELLDPPRQRICLTRMVERMLAAYADSFASRRLILDARLQPDIDVLAGEDLLETVLENVIDNAIEISPKGSKIIVELRALQGRAELSVLDRGPGVPPGELSRIFERYVSLRSAPVPADADMDADEITPHMGIGLWIVRRNLQAIGGSVRAENRPDGGLAMIMRFPLAA